MVGSISLILLFVVFVNIRTRLLCKKKLRKLHGKLKKNKNTYQYIIIIILFSVAKGTIFNKKIKNTDYYYFITGNYGNNLLLLLFIFLVFTTFLTDDLLLFVAAKCYIDYRIIGYRSLPEK